MRVIHQVHPEDFVAYSTQKIREKFLLNNLVSPDKIEVAYTHYDRMIIGGAFPINSELKLETYDELKADYFLSRRELGVVSIGGNGVVTVDMLEKVNRTFALKATMWLTLQNLFSSPLLLMPNILHD
jgi:4-deoxy-L-threo-5-hexosulose-uronate ketol-isomerase